MTDVGPSEPPEARVRRAIDTRLDSAFPHDEGQRDVVRAVYDFYPELLTPAGHPETSVISAESKAVAKYFTDLVRAGLDGEWTAGSFMDPEFGPQFDAVVGVAATVGWKDLAPSYDPEDRGRRLEEFRGAVESAVERMPWIVDTFRGVEDGRDVGGGRRTATMKRIGSEYQPGTILAYAAGLAGFPSTVVPPFHRAEIVPGQVIGAAVRAAPSREVYSGNAPAGQPVADPLLSDLEAEYIGVAAAVSEAAVMTGSPRAAARAARKAVSPEVGSRAGSPAGGTPRTDRDADSVAVRRGPAQPDSAKRGY